MLSGGIGYIPCLQRWQRTSNMTSMRLSFATRITFRSTMAIWKQSRWKGFRSGQGFRSGRTYCWICHLTTPKNDEGKQQFSLDVQTAGCRELIQRKELGKCSVVPYVDGGRGGDDLLTRKGLRELLGDAKRGDI